MTNLLILQSLIPANCTSRRSLGLSTTLFATAEWRLSSLSSLSFRSIHYFRDILFEKPPFTIRGSHPSSARMSTPLSDEISEDLGGEKQVQYRSRIFIPRLNRMFETAGSLQRGHAGNRNASDHGYKRQALIRNTAT